MAKIIVSLLIIAVAGAMADQPPPSYKEPAYDAPASYAFSWAVKDDYSKNDFGQDENRNGASTSGSYFVQLPDGRLQKVSYSVDGYGGYVADVSYVGEAQYPEYKPTYKAAPSYAKPVYKPAPAPAYKPAPAPAYKPAPAPAYKPAPTPAYKPAPTPAYKPAPAPAYKPAPTTPAYKPAPTPAPAPPPTYKPAPEPAPAYKPAPAPAPAYKPAPAPKVYYKPAPKKEEPKVYYKPVVNHPPPKVYYKPYNAA